MEVEADEKDLRAAGAELLTDGRRGLRIHGWEIVSCKGSILNTSTLRQWEQKFQTSHLPEMVFGNSSLILKHTKTGTKIHFNAFDALVGWKQEPLPPVEIPAAANWKFRSKPLQQVLLDYDYTFTTPYCGSETIEVEPHKNESQEMSETTCSLCWTDCDEKIDVVALESKEPILFSDEVVLYKDELADNGVSLLTIKVRVMPSSWFLLLRYWLRVDGVLMRLRDTHMHCIFSDGANPVILRESCWREATFQDLSDKGDPAVSAAYSDPSIISHMLPIILHRTQKLYILGGQPGNEKEVPITEQLRQNQDGVDKGSNLEQLGTPSKDAVNNSNHIRPKMKRPPKSRKKYMLRSLTGSDRVLRSRSLDKPKALKSATNSVNVNLSKEEQKKRKKKRKGKTVVANEYSRIRSHLRYLLNRMNYEKSLIIAYSGEGWKGLSLEKLKPEKELQRATSEIFRRKSKIRDLFRHIDSLCAEGRLPSSLFDSEGQISSEDIFCAKCGSKDLTGDNDIVLCDGACDRGFHQFCLVPPLLKEDIPPDDEGWLCPACDCKVDCIEMLNDSQDTNISVTDNWENVFPEAADAAAGRNLVNNFGLSSDDSDDNDYNPDIPEINGKSEGDESSSDESDFTSASDELGDLPDNKVYLRLPSDDSNDDDYDPEVLDFDEKVKEESSSSDFTSDSEDLAAALDNNELFGEDQSTMSIRAREDSNGRSKLGGKNNQSLKSELLSILASDPSQDGSASISGKRNIERLDYKKLYDETYGNMSSDSNDDEDYTDTVEPRKRRRQRGEISLLSTNGIASISNNGVNTKDMNQDLKESKCTPGKRCHQLSTSEETNISSTKACEGSSMSSSSGKKVGSSSYRRLGDATTQRLHNSFKENQYPDRATKENLAEELGMTVKQVGKWFENARWSFNHSLSMDTMMANNNSDIDSLEPKKTNQGKGMK